MLPTQFIPEYYKDSKDIINADDAEELNQEESRPRRSLFSLIFGLFRRSRQNKEESVASPRERLAHR